MHNEVAVLPRVPQVRFSVQAAQWDHLGGGVRASAGKTFRTSALRASLAGIVLVRPGQWDRPHPTR